MSENEKKIPELDRYKDTALPPWLKKISHGLIELLGATKSPDHFSSKGGRPDGDSHSPSELNDELIISEYKCMPDLPDWCIGVLMSYATDSVNRAKKGQVHIPRYVVLIFEAESEPIVRANARRIGLEIAIAKSGKSHLHVQGTVAVDEVEVVIRLTEENSKIIVNRGLKRLYLDQPSFSQKKQLAQPTT